MNISKKLVTNLEKILKQDEIYLLIPQNKLKEGLDLLFEDYYRQYCLELIKNESKENIELIRFLTNLRFPFNNEKIEANYIKIVSRI